MYWPSDHSVLVEFAKSVNHQFDINVRDFEYLVILACEYNRQDVLDYICKSKSIPFNESRVKSLVDLQKNTKKNIKKEKSMEYVPCCFICVEPFNKSTRSVIKCKCDYTSCKTCVKFYLMSQSQDSHCMNCKVEWDQKFMTDNFDSKFISTEFKKYRENILFERELGMMPQTQILVDNQIQVEKFQSQIRKLQIEKSIIEDKIDDLRLEIYDINNKEVTVRREFVRQCPNGECRGFLSTNLKCNICEKWACGDCREVKGDTRDAEHTCDPDTVESIKALGKEMRECPKCSYKISKVSGCNQMFCTPEYGGCGTAFDWKTLKIETKIHNPHYFDYLRLQNNGQIERNPNEILCGRELDGYFTTRLQSKLNQKNDDTRNILNICRLIIHTNEVDVERFTPITRENGNVDLRISYMRNKITKDDMKIEIQKREKENKKKHEVSNVIGMFVGCMTDIFYRLLDNPLKYNEILTEMNTLRDYTNNCLLNISKSYKCTCWYYNEKFEFDSVKAIKKKKAIEIPLTTPLTTPLPILLPTPTPVV